MFKQEGQSPITARHVEMLQSPAVRRRIVDKYIEQEKNKEREAQSPSVGRPGAIEKSKSLSKIKNAFEFGKGLNDEMEEVHDLQSRKSIHAELELLRSPSSKDISSPMSPTTQRRQSQPKDEKANLVASFFSGQSRERSGSVSLETKKPLPQKIESPKLMSGLQKSSTASDISSYLKYKFDDKPSPKLAQSPKIITPEENKGSPQIQRGQGLAKSSSFSKFKDSFEDGVGLMDSENVDTDKVRVNAELNALKSSNKIQSMFRINKSSRTEEQKKREEKKPPVISVDPPASNYSDTTERKNNRDEPKKEEELQGRKWVFDTIQRYYDVIVEEGEEEEEEDEEEDAQGGEESESDYTSAEDEIPEITLPPINKTLPTRHFAPSTHRASPTLSLPMQRARASTGIQRIIQENFVLIKFLFSFSTVPSPILQPEKVISDISYIY